MNPNLDLVDLDRKLRQSEPNDPRTLMMRAVWDNELCVRFQEMREELTALGVKRFEVKPQSGARIAFYPYLQGRQVELIMSKYWGVKNNKLHFRLPPKFWGLHILIPE